jgi:UDP-N-acetylglucosamine 1-carboxyvinyltransferase
MKITSCQGSDGENKSIESKIVISGSRRPINLRYEDHAQGAKNSVLALMGASLAFNRTQTLSNFPDITDTRAILGLIEQSAVPFSLEGDVFVRLPGPPVSCVFGRDFFDTRAGFYVVAGLIEQLGTITISDHLVGGCQIGDRNFEFIFKVFRAFGIEVDVASHQLTFCKKFKPETRIVLDDLGIVVTGIALILAAQQTQPIKLIKASCAVEINDIITFLCANGSKIERAGERDLLVLPSGTPSANVGIRVQDDRIVIATYIVLCLISGGRFTIDASRLDCLATFISLLVAIGYTVEQSGADCHIYRKAGSVLRPQTITVDDYPAICTDIQPILTVLMCTVGGRSVITDKIFPTRNYHVAQLRKLNQKISFADGQILIDGGQPALASALDSNDMRCSAAILLQASVALGTSTIENWQNVRRGYAHLLTILAPLTQFTPAAP